MVEYCASENVTERMRAGGVLSWIHPVTLSGMVPGKNQELSQQEIKKHENLIISRRFSSCNR